MRIIVAFVEALFPGAAIAQVLTPAGDSGISAWVWIAAAIAALVVGVLIGRQIERNPAKVTAAEDDLATLMRKTHESIDALAAKIAHSPTPDQLTAAKEALDKVQQQIPPKL